MAKQFNKPLKYSGGRKYADTTRREKIIFIVKLVICVGTFGFVFPGVQYE
jgi:hypothetical protein